MESKGSKITEKRTIDILSGTLQQVKVALNELEKPLSSVISPTGERRTVVVDRSKHEEIARQTHLPLARTSALPSTASVATSVNFEDSQKERSGNNNIQPIPSETPKQRQYEQETFSDKYAISAKDFEQQKHELPVSNFLHDDVISEIPRKENVSSPQVIPDRDVAITVEKMPVPPSQSSSHEQGADSTPVGVSASLLAELWEKCLTIIRDNISASNFDTWFEPLKPLRWDGRQLTVQVASQFVVEWIEEHYFDLLRTTIVSVFGQQTQLQYQVVVDRSAPTKSRSINLPAGRSVQPAAQHQHALPFASPSTPLPQQFPNYLNPRYTFDNFIIGESNQLAAAAARAVSDNPGRTKYNPLVIYGDTGLGKTHLIQAIGNRALSLHRNLRVIYTNSERFSIEFVNAVQNNRLNEFNAFYRSVDILIVDDIQFFSTKERTQDIFFHTFNSLHQAGKQIILTSDKPPKDLKGVDERLISRFQWGLTTDIQPPDYETRMAILQQKALDEGCELPHDVLEYIARHVSSSVRELEGALISLLAKTTLDGRELNADLAQEVVGKIQPDVSRPDINHTTIQKTVAEYYGITQEQLISKTRKHEIALARQVAMYLIKKLTSNTLKTIGTQFGGRDHTTVLHSVETVENYLENDAAVQQAVRTIMQRLGRTV